MADSDQDTYTSFLGRGWGFPPSFANGGVRLSEEEQDIHESLLILFGTQGGERFLHPDYGLDMHALLFEPISTSLRSLLIDRVKTAILIDEARIKVLSLDIDSPNPNDGSLHIVLDYVVRSTNTRFNLVYPFYQSDGNELRASVAGARRG